MHVKPLWLIIGTAALLAASLVGDVTLVASRSGSDSTSTATTKAKPSPTPTKPAEPLDHLALRVGRASFPTTKDLRGWKAKGRTQLDKTSTPADLGIGCGTDVAPDLYQATAADSPE